jgi:hypothetical protein
MSTETPHVKPDDWHPNLGHVPSATQHYRGAMATFTTRCGQHSFCVVAPTLEGLRAAVREMLPDLTLDENMIRRTGLFRESAIVEP